MTHSSSSLFRSYHCYCHLSFVTSAASALTCLDHSGVTWNLTSDHKLTQLLSLQLSRVLRLLKYPAEDSENPPQVNVYYCLVKCTAFTKWCLKHVWMRSDCVSYEIAAKPWTRVGPFRCVVSVFWNISLHSRHQHAFCVTMRFLSITYIHFFLPISWVFGLEQGENQHCSELDRLVKLHNEAKIENKIMYEKIIDIFYILTYTKYIQCSFRSWFLQLNTHTNRE